MKYDKQTLMDIFRIGAEIEFVYQAANVDEAYRLRQMLYYYRKKLKQDKDEFYEVANKVSISIRNNSLIAVPAGLPRLDQIVEKYKKKRNK